MGVEDGKDRLMMLLRQNEKTLEVCGRKVPIKYAQFGLCLLMTVFWAGVAHFYGFSNGLFSHDSLNALVADQTEELWKVQLGRFVVPLYRMVVRPSVAAPWLIGCLSILFLSMTLFLVSELFDVTSWLAKFLAAGVLVTNLTVSALTATYIYELDVDMLALLLVVFSVWCGKKGKHFWFLGALMLSLSMGIYQSYLSVAIVFVVLKASQSLIRKEDFKTVLFYGLKNVLMVLAGGVIYYVLVRLACLYYNTTLANTYNGLSNLWTFGEHSVLSLILGTYKDYWHNMNHLIPAYSAEFEIFVNVCLLTITLIAAVIHIRKNEIKKLEALALVLLGATLPFFMNVLFVLNNGDVHDLMRYAFWLTYLIPLFLCFAEKFETPGAKAISGLAAILILVILWGNVQSSNVLYLKKELEQNATLAEMTRVVDMIEQSEDYQAGETEVAVFGKYNHNQMEGFEEYYAVTGSTFTSAISVTTPMYYFNIYEMYFNYILSCNINLCSDEVWLDIKQSEELAAMPCFPKDGCTRMIDGVLVIKISET